MDGVDDGLWGAEKGGAVVELGELNGPIAGVDEQLTRDTAGLLLVVGGHYTTGGSDADVGDSYHARRWNESEHDKG